ncbi:unnamed protein product [Caenorhabditis angaria]|uniref:Methyltransferase FkbM domain-containing protein n=1 Tax=Caenorhabditis angaria TaxID=860376 RepID=A0A9P1MUZ7_9PELO|nr:unnamed protein product [Caenorhabditis angaria]
MQFFEIWQDCVEKELEFNDEPHRFWDQFRYRMERCETLVPLKIEDFENSDETKHAILPKNQNDVSENIVVTIGIGQDIAAELKFKEQMNELGKWPVFYGADPIVEPNSQIFSKIGVYFPFAIGDKAGFSEASVLVENEYKMESVVHVDLVYFLDKMLNLKTIDHLWMDSEYSEYQLFDAFYRNGRLDDAEITICQINLEVHNPSLDQKILFKQFIRRLLSEKRYGFFRNIYYSHYRLFLVNFENDYCVRKYIS